LSLRFFVFIIFISLFAIEKTYSQMNSTILNEVQEYVSKLLLENTSEKFYYHTLKHTEEVVNAAFEISQGENLDQDGTEIVLIAAWFHDVGYTQKIKGHEEISAMFASNFLLDKNYPSGKIDSVIACIMSTKVPQKPNSLLQKIICDADLHHLGKETFFERNELFKKELEATQNKKQIEVEFIANTIAFMNEHQFFTNYSRKFYQPIKGKNIELLKEKLNSLLK